MKNIIGRESIYKSDYTQPPYMCRSVAMNKIVPVKKLEEPKAVKPQRYYDSETFVEYDANFYVPMDLLWYPKDIVRSDPGDKFINPYLYKKSYDDAEEVNRPRIYMSPAVSLDNLPPPERAELCEKMYRSTWNARGEPPSIENAATKCLNYKRQQFTTAKERPGDYVRLKQQFFVPIRRGWQRFARNWDSLQLRSGCDPTRHFWLTKDPPVKCGACFDPCEKLKDPKVSEKIVEHVRTNKIRIAHDFLPPGYAGYKPNLARGVDLTKIKHPIHERFVTTYEAMSRVCCFTLSIDMALLISVYILGVLTAVLADKKPPHIVFIIADDLGWNDVGFHGSSQIRTPNIDALAYNGLILNSHYTMHICTPSRAALMTGVHPIHMGMQGFPILTAEPRALPPGKLLPGYLKDLGYSTHLVGKWHLGSSRFNETPTFRGFDSHLGNYMGYGGYYDHTCQSLPIDEDLNTRSGYDMWRNTTVAWDLDGTYVTDIYTKEAVRVINQHPKSKPLFLVVSHVAAHSGNKAMLLEAPLSSVQKHHHIADISRRNYAGMVSKLDDSVGEVVESLRNNNMLENSILVFISDNGAPTAGLFSNWGSNYPFRGIKVSTWEGAIRTVACIWSPLINQRGISNSLIHIMDWLPTLVTAAGGNTSTLKLDGLDQWPMLNEGVPVRNEFLVNIDLKRTEMAIRRDKWKLMQGISNKPTLDTYSGETGDENKWKVNYNITEILSSPTARALSEVKENLKEKDILAIRSAAVVTCRGRVPDNENKVKSTCCSDSAESFCLFDLEWDPCELSDVSHLHPEIFEEMKTSLKSYMNEVIPELNQLPSPAGRSELHNYTWSPWLVESFDNIKNINSIPEAAVKSPAVKVENNVMIYFVSFFVGIILIFKFFCCQI